MKYAIEIDGDIEEIRRGLIEEMEGLEVFPLQTQQSMAERWGVSRQNVAAWAQRHNNFPKPIEGIIEQTPGAPKLYPLYEVEKYEKLRGLGK